MGQLLAAFALEDMQVRVLSLRRSDGKLAAANANIRLEESDTLVLSGTAEALALAEQRLLRGAPALRAQSPPSQ
jgi:CPA2 family monovalent cation:H+ antiporter-2